MESAAAATRVGMSEVSEKRLTLVETVCFAFLLLLLLPELVLVLETFFYLPLKGIWDVKHRDRDSREGIGGGENE